MRNVAAGEKSAQAEARPVRGIYDVAVIGGGASGMTAAIASAALGADTVLLEAQPRVGRKLLSTGSGRCNISNTDISPSRYRTDCPERLKTVLDGVGEERVRGFFLDIGVPLTADREGRLYPRGDAAAGVLDMLRFELSRAGAEMIADTRVTAISRGSGIWRIDTGAGKKALAARAVVIACGSPAAPQLGGCADGDAIAAKLGVRIIKRRPALCPLMSDSELLRSLRGLRAKCRVSLEVRGKDIRSEEGELQFGDGCLSGICIFQLSSSLSESDIGSARVTVDLLPEMTADGLLAALRARRERLKGLALEDVLTGLLNKRIAMAALRLAGIGPMTRKAGTLTDAELAQAAAAIKSMAFRITGCAGWKQSQSALGGIPLSDAGDDLSVNGQPGLFACGEALNCSGDCGGFNLHWAWCSGITAGESAAAYCGRRGIQAKK